MTLPAPCGLVRPARGTILDALTARVAPVFRMTMPLGVRERLTRNAELMAQAGMRTGDDVDAWLAACWHTVSWPCARALGFTVPPVEGDRLSSWAPEWTPAMVGVGLGALELAAAGSDDAGFANGEDDLRFPPGMMSAAGSLTERTLLDPAWLAGVADDVAAGRHRLLARVRRLPFAQHQLLRSDLQGILVRRPAEESMHPHGARPSPSQWRTFLARIGSRAMVHQGGGAIAPAVPPRAERPEPSPACRVEAEHAS